jgi:hypothetical protein
MTEKTKQDTWLRAIEDAAKERSIKLPPFNRKPMGLASTEPSQNGRFITVRYRLLPRAEALKDGIQWTLRQTGSDAVDLTFRQPANPEKEAVNSTLEILKGWILDNLSIEETRAVIDQSLHDQSS